MSQYTGQFIPADLELGIAEHLTKDLVTLGIIGPGGGIKSEYRSRTGLDDPAPCYGGRMLRLIDDQDGLLGEID